MRVLPAIAALALSAGTPAAAQQSSYDDAVAARRAGDPARAAALLESLLKAQPDNADALVQYGFALLALDRLAEADAAFAGALAVAPAYGDATLGRAIVAERQGRIGDARRLVAAVPPGNPDAAQLSARVNRQTVLAPWSADLDASYAAVERGQPDWKEAALQIRHQSASGVALAGRVEASRRFARNDTYFEGRADKFFAGGSSVYVFAGATPNADYRPKWQVGGGLRYAISGGPRASILTADLRHADYVSGRVTTLNPGIEQYVMDGRAWLTGQLVNVISGGRLRSGFLARGDIMTGDRVRLFAGAAYAPDTSEGAVNRVLSAFGGAWLNLDARHSLRLTVARVDPRDGPSRTEAAVGAGVRF